MFCFTWRRRVPWERASGKLRDFTDIPFDSGSLYLTSQSLGSLLYLHPYPVHDTHVVLYSVTQGEESGTQAFSRSSNLDRLRVERRWGTWDYYCHWDGTVFGVQRNLGWPFTEWRNPTSLLIKFTERRERGTSRPSRIHPSIPSLPYLSPWSLRRVVTYFLLFVFGSSGSQNLLRFVSLICTGTVDVSWKVLEDLERTSFVSNTFRPTSTFSLIPEYKVIVATMKLSWVFMEVIYQSKKTSCEIYTELKIFTLKGYRETLVWITYLTQYGRYFSSKGLFL